MVSSGTARRSSRPERVGGWAASASASAAWVKPVGMPWEWMAMSEAARGYCNLHRQGLVMTRNATTDFEDFWRSRKQQRRAPLQGSTRIVGAFRGGIRMGARRGTFRGIVSWQLLHPESGRLRAGGV